MECASNYLVKTEERFLPSILWKAKVILEIYSIIWHCLVQEQMKTDIDGR